jgi:hypothetical protein
MTFSTECVQRKKKVRSTLVILLNPQPRLWIPPSWINFLFCNMIKNTKTYLPQTQHWMIKFNKNPILKDKISKKNLKDKKIKWNEMLIKKKSWVHYNKPQACWLKRGLHTWANIYFSFYKEWTIAPFFWEKKYINDRSFVSLKKNDVSVT